MHRPRSANTEGRLCFANLLRAGSSHVSHIWAKLLNPYDVSTHEVRRWHGNFEMRFAKVAGFQIERGWVFETTYLSGKV